MKWKHFTVTWIVGFLIYLALTAYSGSILLWSAPEIIAGLCVATLVAVITNSFFVRKLQFMNPVRWFMFLYYVFVPFFWGMLKANVDVAIRVINGKINPGIVKISPGLKTDLGITMLATSITLTPGTVSVEVNEKDKSLYIHWIDVTARTPRCEDICGPFAGWSKKIMEPGVR